MKLVKLKPATKDYIWAGDKLKKWGKEAPYDNIAECWELSFHKDGPSLIDSGEEKGKRLMDVATKDDIGTYASSFPFFPVLIKLIDSGSNLSVQVHPDDAYALKKEDSFGKTEMWYVISHEKGAGLYVGLKEDSTKEEIKEALENSTILEKLNFFPVEDGDCFFIPSGTIHAIGKGVSVIEIQQNSNLTYRLYDYDRVGKDGKKRELHIEKALEVIDYHKYKRPTFQKGVIGRSKYFVSYRKDAKKNPLLSASSDSFVTVTFLSGEGMIGDLPYHALDTFFLPASQKVKIKGDGIYVMTRLEHPTHVIGVDIGGTSIKVGLVDQKGKILEEKAFSSVNINQRKAMSLLCDTIQEILDDQKMTIDQIKGIGVGCPGSINSEKGVCEYANNLPWGNFKIATGLRKRFPVEVKVNNDANCAALGEYIFGGHRKYQNILLVTLGTGVGGGIIIDGKLYGGKEGKGGEIGHTLFSLNGRDCTCGQKGCFEAYTSVTALIKDTKEILKDYPNSILYEMTDNDLSKINGKMICEAYQKKDEAATKAFDRYVMFLSEGLLSFMNIFRMDAILLGGGLAESGETLLGPVREYCEKRNYGFGKAPKVEIQKATLGNKAGILGAASLLFES